MADNKHLFNAGDEVNVRTKSGAWQREAREIVQTWYDTKTGRMYKFNNGDVVPERDVRKSE